MTFWILIATLTVLALVFAVPPLWFKSKESLEQVEQRKALNVAIYKERLAELEASGLMAKEFAQAKQELEKSLLSEIDTLKVQTTTTGARWSAAVVLLTVPVLAGALYWKTGSPQAAIQNTQNTQVATAAHTGQGQAGNEIMPSIDEMVEKLAERLEEKPDDAKGWEMLGRSYVVMERYDEAMPAFAKAVELTKDQPDAELISSYAETIAMTKEGLLTGKPDELLAQAMKIDAKHPKTLWLVGLSAVQKGDYPTAVQHWEMLLTQLPPDSEGAQSVTEHIAELKRNMIDTTGGIAANSSMAEAEAPAAASKPTQTNAADKPVQLTISVTLDEKLKAQAASNDTLFVYARAAQGPRMPLAITRKQVKDLPITVTLDDSMAMMPAMKLSSVSQVIAMARVSKSGSAMTQSGDIVGESEALDLSKINTVSVIINQQVP